MSGRCLLGVSEALYLKPLVWGLGKRSVPCDLHTDIPAKLAYDMNERTGHLRCALLSPIDYGRRGGDFRIVPGVCASSSAATGTVRLFVRQDVRNIATLAVDVRVTSEIILAKILLAERFSNLPSASAAIRYVPMMPDLGAMLKRSDAALITQADAHLPQPEETFSLDLVQEWNELTGLPYVHALWIAREGALDDELARALLGGRDEAMAGIQAVAQALGRETGLPAEEYTRYFSEFSYTLEDTQVQSLEEFFHYAYYHGVLPDKPDLNFYEPGVSSGLS